MVGWAAFEIIHTHGKAEELDEVEEMSRTCGHDWVWYLEPKEDVQVMLCLRCGLKESDYERCCGMDVKAQGARLG